MTRLRGSVVVVDDDLAMVQMLEEDLARRGLDVRACTSAETALRALADAPADALLTDLRMPGMDGLELCRRAHETDPQLPVVVMTAFGSMDSAVEALRAGAADFVSKPIELELLALTLERALRLRELERRVARLDADCNADSNAADAAEFEGLVGASEPMQRLYERIRRVAAVDSSVLIQGESGTGKELVARALHARSARATSGPFVAVNCAALPPELLESELFGHAKGAFTGAGAPRDGLFREADGGTLLLDEIGELPLALQPKLLRALEQRRVRPVGGDSERGFDARILAATHRDLTRDARDGAFREDLLYRIDTVRLETPPLRARGADVLLLARRLIADVARRSGRPVTGLTDAAARRLLTHDWPGNVRELRNVIERAVLMTDREQLVPADLQLAPTKHAVTRLHDDLPSLEELERRYILHVLERVGGNRSRAAQLLDIDRKTLYRKLQRYEA